MLLTELLLEGGVLPPPSYLLDVCVYWAYTFTMDAQSGKSERIATRVTPDQKAIIAEAAAASGYTLTEFVVESAQRNAIRVLEERRVVRLASEHQERLARALLDPPKPNEALKAAAKAYDKAKITSR